MQLNWLQQLLLLLRQNLKAEMHSKDQLLSPLLFGLMILCLFSFVFEPPTAESLVSYVVLQCALSILLALQIAYPKIYSSEEEAIRLLPTYDISYSAWYLSKLILAVLNGFLIAFTTAIFAMLFNPKVQFFHPLLPFVLLFALSGMSAVGILLCALTRKASGKEVLFPLLYYPLTLPVLLSACQISSDLLLGSSALQISKWFALLGGFNVIYVVLGLVLYEELI